MRQNDRRFGGTVGRLARALILICGVGLSSGCGSTDRAEFVAPAKPSGPPVLTERPTTYRSEQLVGSWGLASFREEKDRKRTQAQALEHCKQSYRIARGPTGGVMMHAADDPDLHELRLKGGSDGKTYLGFEAPPGHEQDREILSMTEREIVMRFVDPTIATRYGTFIYVRCAE